MPRNNSTFAGFASSVQATPIDTAGVGEFEHLSLRIGAPNGADYSCHGGRRGV